VATGERTADFRLETSEIDRVIAASQPAITFLCSPNNPTGRAEPPELLDHTVSVAPGLVVVDEAYGQFSPWSAVERVHDERPLAVVRTYSKTWAMAAARLGYLIGPAPLVSDLEKVALPYHLDAVKQAAGRLAVKYRAEMEARVAILMEERGRLAAALSEMPVDTWPSDSNFILFRPRERDGRDVWQALLDRSVLVRDCTSWPRLAGCLRVTVGTPDENSAFLSALKEALA
jgi:histidinol-phosphate aminotransferase